MSSLTLFLLFIPILAIILLGINLLFATHNPDINKNSQFECGFASFVHMSRLAFTISFFIYALLFLLFDLEILLVYPYVASSYNNDIYGLIVMLIFFILLTVGFVYELGTKALQIDSRQTLAMPNVILKSDIS
jgi:NADH-ubiquinone oxidoreductase chain 3